MQKKALKFEMLIMLAAFGLATVHSNAASAGGLGQLQVDQAGSPGSIDSGIVRAITDSLVPQGVMEDTVLSSAAANAAAVAPAAGATVTAVTPVGGGRYNIAGIARDQSGAAACALALASGQCMFTCGPGSLRCEGGTANLPFGQFELLNLPTEADGSIVLQVFVQGHISYTETLRPSAPPSSSVRWGATTDTCCTTGPLTFSATVDGVTKRSVTSSCAAAAPTWEGWASTSAGTKSVAASASAPACSFAASGAFTSSNWAAGGCYIVTGMFDATSGTILIGDVQVDCSLLP